MLDIPKSRSDSNSFDEKPRKLLQRLDTLVKKLTFLTKFPKKKLQQMELENELHLSEMGSINDTSIDNINSESSKRDCKES